MEQEETMKVQFNKQKKSVDQNPAHGVNICKCKLILRNEKMFISFWT